MIKGILFDLYGTLIDIETNESMEEIYRAIAHYLTYQGVYLHRWEIKERYYQIMKQQKEARGEEYPEIDVEAIWNELLMQEEIGVRPGAGSKGYFAPLPWRILQSPSAISRRQASIERIADGLSPSAHLGCSVLFCCA